MAKSKFVFKENFGQDMNDLLASVDENLGINEKIKQETIPVNHIKILDNPRRLNIAIKDITDGLHKEDPLYEKKLKEYEDLQSLAESIKEQGLLHDVHVFEEGANFILVMGQRRVLASLIAGKKTISAKIWKTKPKEKMLKAYQWVENINREDLPLLDVIDSAREMIHLCMKNNKKTEKITVREVAKVLYCGKTKAAYLCNLINLKPDIKKAVVEGKITSIKIAAELNKIEDDHIRKEFLTDNEKLNDAALTKTKKILSQKAVKKNSVRGAQPTRVKFGHTKDAKVAEYLIAKLVELPELNDCRNKFINQGNDYRTLSQMFSSILEILEQKL